MSQPNPTIYVVSMQLKIPADLFMVDTSDARNSQRQNLRSKAVKQRSDIDSHTGHKCLAVSSSLAPHETDSETCKHTRTRIPRTLGIQLVNF